MLVISYLDRFIGIFSVYFQIVIGITTPQKKIGILFERAKHQTVVDEHHTE